MMIYALKEAGAGASVQTGVNGNWDDQRRHVLWEDYWSLYRATACEIRRLDRIILRKSLDGAQEAFEISAPLSNCNACASGTNAIGHVFECVRSSRYERVLTGGYDALSELVFVGFVRFGVDARKCRPFDRHRTGMVWVKAQRSRLRKISTPREREARSAK
jgi:hypothetical protein